MLVADRLGAMLEEFHATGGLDPARMDAAAGVAGPMIGSVVAMGIHTGLVVETRLDPSQPFLNDHRIDGTPVLPGVMGIEGFAEVATLLLPDDWQVQRVEDVRFLAPLKFYRDEPRLVRLEATLRPEGDGLVADCRLLGSRTLPGQATPQVTTHFTARVHVGCATAPVERLDPPQPPDGRAVAAEDIYQIYFHGPAYRVLERVWRDGDRIVGLMARDLPVDRLPPESPTRLAPRLIELCFQTAGIAEIAPGALNDVSDERLFAVVSPRADGSFDASVVDEAGIVQVALHDYRTVALPASVTEERMAPLQAVAE